MPYPLVCRLPARSAARLRRGALVATVALAGLGLAAPATAQGYLVADPVGDSTATTSSMPAGSSTPTSSGPMLAPGNRNGDISGFGIDHGRRRVVARVDMVDFDAPPASDDGTSSSDTLAGALLQLETRSPHRTYDVLGLFDGTHAGWAITRDSGRAVACRGFTHTLDADHRVTFSIPRRCLGNPRSLRAGAGSVIETETDSAAGSTLLDLVDDAQVAGVPDTEHLALGRWLRRG